MEQGGASGEIVERERTVRSWGRDSPRRLSGRGSPRRLSGRDSPSRLSGGNSNSFRRAPSFSRQVQIEEDTGPLGVLVLKIERGADLVARDRGGSSDPYIVARLGGAKFTTRTCRRTLNPEWEETMEFPGYLSDLVASPLELRVYDADKFSSQPLGRLSGFAPLAPEHTKVFHEE